MLEHLTKALDLTPDQVKELKPIFESTREQMKALHEDQSLTKEQKRERFMAIRKENREKMNKVLTPDQQKKLDDLKKERMARCEGGGCHKGGPKGDKDGKGGPKTDEEAPE